MSRSAPDLIRGLGLLVDGPVRWGERVGAGGPGIYVVEWPRPEPQAPIDHGALRAWLAHVPALRLDGAEPTPHELAARLASFWLPTETVVYVGSTTRSLRTRLAAQAATVLGDRRPNAGGHWLKTLEHLGQARVWWAATDAAEEYADALLEAFAAELGQPGALPFANLSSAAGRRAHGLTGSLLADEEPAPTAGGRPPGRPGTRVPGPTTSSRARSTAGSSRSGAPRVPLSGPASPPRRTRRAAPKTAPKAVEPAYLSAGGLAKVEAELADLREVQRPQVIGRVASARELGDLRENAEYHAAREEHAFLEGRILQLQDLVDRAVVVEGGGRNGLAALGSTVTLADLDAADAEMTITIVGTAEADSRAGRVSDRSPIGAAVLGHRAGDEIAVRTPAGERRYKVREVA
ncbi:MAG TPA: transcription elongation factor GreA [Candidatus Limnocylindrales bacterium]|nr:transcription elongation factor GreA [Candidatus Limnocylindrales bacterium]